jgi:LysM repeat protein
LDVNPRNADAHLGLGIIHSDSAKIPEYGFAYYHLRRYVVLSGRTNDLIVNQLIRATGLRLAELHADTIGKIQTQGQLEQIRRENDELRKSVLSLSNQLYSASTRIATPTLLVSSPTNGTVAAPARAPSAVPKATDTPTRLAARAVEPRKPSTPKTYTLKSGDTLAKIAKAQGITLQQLQAANPSVDTRKLKPGVEIRVP